MRTLYFCPAFFWFFLAYSQLSHIYCLPYFHTWCDLGANLECRSETCCTWLPENTGCKKSPKKSPSRHHRTSLSGYIFATKAYVDNRKKMVNSNTSCTRPHNKFGPLVAEIGPVVWGTPGNFNGCHVLAALLRGTLVVGISQTLQR